MEKIVNLPEEIRQKIDKEAADYASLQIGDIAKLVVPATVQQWHDAKADHLAVATVWATRYQGEVDENARLRKALDAKLESRENRDFAYLGPEAEAVIYAVYDGCETCVNEFMDYKRSVATRMLAIRDALVARDIDEAYHECYSFADPEFKYMDNPWKDLEALAQKGGSNDV